MDSKRKKNFIITEHVSPSALLILLRLFLLLSVITHVFAHTSGVTGLQSGVAVPPLKWFWANRNGELAMSSRG